MLLASTGLEIRDAGKHPIVHIKPPQQGIIHPHMPVVLLLINPELKQIRGHKDSIYALRLYGGKEGPVISMKESSKAKLAGQRHVLH